MVYIYTLSHPITNEVRYVGKTINLKRRYKQHLYDKRTTHKCNWVKSLKNEGLKPVLTVIEVCYDNWQEREIYWISQFNNLTNFLDGGGTNYVKQTSNETKEKIRQANLGKRLTDEHKFKISQNTNNKQKILIDNILYNSITEAANILQLSWFSINRRLKSENYPNFQYLTK